VADGKKKGCEVKIKGEKVGGNAMIEKLKYAKEQSVLSRGKDIFLNTLWELKAEVFFDGIFSRIVDILQREFRE